MENVTESVEHEGVTQASQDPSKNGYPTESLIVQDPDTCWGVPRLAGTRIPVPTIILQARHHGGDLLRVQGEFPYLTLEQLQACLDYYQAHPEAIDTFLERSEESYKHGLQRRPAYRT